MASLLKILFFTLIALSMQQTNAFTLPMTLIGERFYYHSRFDKNWEDANSYCRNNNLRLVSFETESELNGVSNWMIHHKGFQNDWECWTSGSELAVRGAYKWTANNQPLTFNGWAPGQPDRKDGKEHCMTAKNVGGMLLFNDADCGLARCFICESQTSIDQTLNC